VLTLAAADAISKNSKFPLVALNYLRLPIDLAPPPTKPTGQSECSNKGHRRGQMVDTVSRWDLDEGEECATRKEAKKDGRPAGREEESSHSNNVEGRNHSIMTENIELVAHPFSLLRCLTHSVTEQEPVISSRRTSASMDQSNLAHTCELTT
jgi:hypothetical protein